MLPPGQYVSISWDDVVDKRHCFMLMMKMIPWLNVFFRHVESHIYSAGCGLRHLIYVAVSNWDVMY